MVAPANGRYQVKQNKTVDANDGACWNENGNLLCIVCVWNSDSVCLHDSSGNRWIYYPFSLNVSLCRAEQGCGCQSIVTVRVPSSTTTPQAEDGPARRPPPHPHPISFRAVMLTMAALWRKCM